MHVLYKYIWGVTPFQRLRGGGAKACNPLYYASVGIVHDKLTW